MTRITGNDVSNLMEAYSTIYAPQELTEEQVWEEVEVWVNSLIEEGYDLSEYTWEEMYDAYIEEQGGRMSGPERREQQAQIRANRPVPRVTPTTRTQTGQGSRPIGSTTRRGGGVQAQFDRDTARMNAARARTGENFERTALPKKPSPRDLGRQVQQNAPKNEPMVLRGPDGRPLGSRPSTPAAKTTPTPSGTSPRPSTPASRPAPTSSGTAPRPSTPASRPAPTSSGTAPRPSTPASRPASTTSTPTPQKKFNPLMQKTFGYQTGQQPTKPSGPKEPNVTGMKSGRLATALSGPMKRVKEEYDDYDIVLYHLLDEGYADTEEAATVIMANMSEEWKQSIVEGDALQNTIKTLEGKRDKMNAKNPGSANVSRDGKQSVGAATYKAYQRLRGV